MIRRITCATFRRAGRKENGQRQSVSVLGCSKFFSMREHSVRIPHALAALAASVLTGGLCAVLQAGQSQSAAANVYSTAQAARGQQLYGTQCATCHGNTLEGSSGPPLAGEVFLTNWSARTAGDLVDKIQKTMPFDMPMTLSRQQSIDLAAFVFQTAKYPPGSTDLREDALAHVTFPAVAARPNPTAASASASLPAPEGNLAELMRAIAFPNSNIIFNVQVKDPGAAQKKELAASPFDYVAWGSTVYPGWLAVDQAAIAIAETAPLLLTPGRRCQNGRPVPVERADWKQYVADLVDVARLAHRAAQSRNAEAFVDVTDKLNNACANCHKVYRDKGGSEGSGVGRCQ
jgi:S-disulfanyl-L-cysteine oxidoreductase SoxD